MNSKRSAPGQASRAQPVHRQSNLPGCLWMVGGGLLFVVVMILVRQLGSDMPAVEAAFIRYLFGFILLIPLMLRMQWRRVDRVVGGLYLIRGVAHGAAVMLWFYAMARIPLAEVTAIGYTTPIFTSIGAILVFREHIRMRRMVAILAAFLGALVILRPGFQVLGSGTLAQLLAAPCFAASFLLAKRLTRSENPGDTLIMLSLFTTLALLPGALFYWRNPSILELGGLALVAVFATAGHYAVTRAISSAPLTVTQPLSFLQMIWSILFGFWLFDETPDSWVLAGSAVIVIAVSYMTHREAVAARRLPVRPGTAAPVGTAD